jgi:hypothetical protein
MHWRPARTSLGTKYALPQARFSCERALAMQSQTLKRTGKIKYGVAAWLLGLPLPIVILALFFRGCDW